MSIYGKVYWITGLAGSGKTTFGKRLYNLIKLQKEAIFFCDGDEMRKVLGFENCYRKDDRLKIAMIYSRMCKKLADQGIDVICTTISMFDSCRDWNRKNITNYNEIYIKVPFEILKRRNQKKLYSHEKNVVGVDIDFEEPQNSDIILVNDEKISLDSLFNILCEAIKINTKGTICNGTIQNYQNHILKEPRTLN